MALLLGKALLIMVDPERVSSLDQYFSSELHVLGRLISTDHVLFQVLRLANSWPRLAQDLASLKTILVKISNRPEKFRNVP